jgi:hypothetical protein
MARHLWSIPCALMLTDQLSNSVSYVQAIESLSTTQLPTIAPAFSVGSLWLREKEESVAHTRIRVVAPDGAVVYEVALEPMYFRHFVRMRQQSVIGGFSITRAGTYEIRVEQQRGADWVVEARLPIEFVVTTQEELASLQQQRIAAATTAA